MHVALTSNCVLGSKCCVQSTELKVFEQSLKLKSVLTERLKALVKKKVCLSIDTTLSTNSNITYINVIIKFEM